MNLSEFRCTRNTPYKYDCLGRDDWSYRQGYYLTAKDVTDALAQMAVRFPHDTEGFTATKWQGFDVAVIEVQRKG